MVEYIDTSGEKKEVELVTFLNTADKSNSYVVFTKGETRGENNNRIIYVSKIYKDAEDYKLEEITSDEEWKNVQVLLKKIANAD